MKVIVWQKSTGIVMIRLQSEFIHTLAAAKICWTAADISGPMPSPGISVTVCYHI